MASRPDHSKMRISHAFDNSAAVREEPCRKNRGFRHKKSTEFEVDFPVISGDFGKIDDFPLSVQGICSGGHGNATAMHAYLR